MIDLFHRYDVVGLPELHGSKEVHEFLRALVADPRLGESGVTNIVVEFGNSRLQATADRYMRGDELPIDQVRAMWRETGQFLVWDSPVYEQFFRTIRELNASRPTEKRWRVLLGDSPIDWRNVQTKDDFANGDRERVFESIVEKEVLAKHQKALLVIGRMHLLYLRDLRAPSPVGLFVGELLHRKYPDRVFNFWAVDGPIAGVSGSPRAVVVRDTALGRESFAPYAPKGQMACKDVDGKPKCAPLAEADWPPLAQMTDGLIYYAATSTTVAPDRATYLDAAYVTELRRRAAILDAMLGTTDHVEQLEAMVAH